MLLVKGMQRHTNEMKINNDYKSEDVGGLCMTWFDDNSDSSFAIPDHHEPNYGAFL